MYRLLLYFLIVLFAAAVIFSIFGLLPYNPASLIGSALFITAVAWITNTAFAKTFGTVTNLESIYISALILALIIPPFKNFHDLGFLFWVAIWTMASKYIFAINKKHLFNPVAFAVFLTYFTLNRSANWWIGTAIMMPFVLIGGLLIVRKIRRFDMVFYFLVVALSTIVGLSILKGSDPLLTLNKAIFDSPILFFAFVMLTEPQTTPPAKTFQIIYGSIIGFLFAPQLKIAGLTTTPEIALLIGNIFSYFISPKSKLLLNLVEKIKIAPDIYDFVFTSNGKLAFNPGQYLEWTLGYPSPDSRGNRRYFTIASSPTENNIRLGVKFYPKPSSFKKNLLEMTENTQVLAGQLSGEFILPKDPNKKMVFIAGGIGVTPFRSIIKYLLDKNEKRDIIQFFSNKFSTDIVYTDIFNEAFQKLGIRTIYTLTEIDQIPPDWQGKRGYISVDLIKQEVPDYRECIFYLSGPHSMVAAFEKTLSQMGIPKSQIKVDYFPGFA